jgi:hypothetical protein
MNRQETSQRWPPFRWNVEEIAGAVGDFGTLFPLALGVAIVSKVHLGHILLFFAIWHIVTGLYYKLPLHVQPMKTIGAIVIAGGLRKQEIVASGIILGVFFLGIGLFKGMKFIREKVPLSVIRGIQLGLALLLIKTSTHFIIGDYVIASICILIVVGFLLVHAYGNFPDVAGIVIIVFGIIVGFALSGIPRISMMSLPTLTIPTMYDFLTGGWLLAIPQAPLTVTNAILATTTLLQDLLHKDVDPDTLSKSIGLMSLTSVPFGGFPMCHGAGGLAAQYRFGARTGGANIISGLILLPIALFFASPEFIAVIPHGVFGALLVFVAIELGRHGLKTDSYGVTGIVAVVALASNITIAFIVGMVAAYVITTARKRLQ